MPWTDEHFTRLKVPEKLPVVLSAEEVEQFFGHIGILKHRAALMLCYGSGLRSSEAVSVKITDLDSKGMLIRVQQGKGAKDRYTVLSGRLLILLRLYYKVQRPVEWLPLSARNRVSGNQSRHAPAARHHSGGLP